jgi:hypothetical protein
MAFSTMVLPPVNGFLTYSTATYEWLSTMVLPPMMTFSTKVLLNFSDATYEWHSQLWCCHLNC